MLLEQRIEFVPEQKPRAGGVTVAIVASMVVHTTLVIYLIRNYRPVGATTIPAPIVHYVELMRQNPRDFVEAPGPKINSAPLTAPYSDANRKASIPKPTGDTPTNRPGDGAKIFTPPMGQSASSVAAQAAAEIRQPAQQQQQQQSAASQQPQQQASPGLAYRQMTKAGAATSGPVDWQNAIREVGKVASLGGQQGIDLSGVAGGGDKGFAESGPLSFETQWFDWGEYAQSMVSRIRVNWYSNMPQLIKTGMKGVVTIRFTIHRNGSLTDVTIITGSGVPPYDFAAKKAIELSSPLNPLPKDFPKETEHVTAMFFYNQEPPTN